MGLVLSAMLVPLGSTMIAVALPAIGSEFQRSAAELTQWLVNSYLVVNLVALAPAGRLGDRWGHRNALALGQVLFGLGCVMPIAWPSFAVLVASRVLMALGGALMVPTVMALLRLSVPPARVHRVLGYFGAMMSFAAAVGPSLGGILVHRFGWEAIFLVNLPPLFLSVFFSVGFFRTQPGERPSPAGASDGKTSSLALFRDRGFLAGCAMVALLNLGMYTLLFELPFLLQLLYQWGPGRSGQFMTVFMLSMMVGSAAGGRFAEFAGARAACLAGSLVSAAGVGSLWFLAPGSGELALAAGLLMAGAGVGLANGPSNSAALATIARAMTGVAAGVLSSCRYLGGVLGITVLAILLSAPAAAALEQHRLALALLAGFLLLAAFVSLSLPGRAKSG